MSHSTQAYNIGKFIKSGALALIPVGLREDIVKLIQVPVKKIASERRKVNYYRNRANAFHQYLQEYGLLVHGNKTNEAISDSTKYRRLKQIDKFVIHHDQTVNDVIDLASTFALKSIHTNLTANSILRNEMMKQFIRDQNTITKQLNNDHDYQTRIFFAGFIQGWSKRDMDKFNQVVEFS